MAGRTFAKRTAVLVVAGIYMGVSNQINDQLATKRARISGTVQIGNEVIPGRCEATAGAAAATALTRSCER
jgi:hypothetical protein